MVFKQAWRAGQSFMSSDSRDLFTSTEGRILNSPSPRLFVYGRRTLNDAGMTEDLPNPKAHFSWRLRDILRGRPQMRNANDRLFKRNKYKKGLDTTLYLGVSGSEILNCLTGTKM